MNELSRADIQELKHLSLESETFDIGQTYEKALDEVLQSWRVFSQNFERNQYSSIGYRSQMGEQLKRLMRENNVNHDHVPVRLNYEYLERVDDVIMSLPRQQKSLIKYEVFNKKDRKRVDNWCAKWCQLPHHYRSQLSSLRKHLISELIKKK